MRHHGVVTGVLLSLLHLGALHPVEKGLTLLLAFGPFVVLAVVVAVRRRQDAAAQADGADAADAGQQPPPSSQPPSPGD